MHPLSRRPSSGSDHRRRRAALTGTVLGAAALLALALPALRTPAAVGPRPLEVTAPSEGAAPTPSATVASVAVAVIRDGVARPLPIGPAAAAAGTVQIRVLDAAGTTVADLAPTAGGADRVAGLPDGAYRLLVTHESDVVEPSPGIAIGAASAQITEPVQLVAGDTLVVSIRR